MTGYVPRDGETVLVTFRAEFRELDGGSVYELEEAGIAWWPAAAALRVEPVEFSQTSADSDCWLDLLSDIAAGPFCPSEMGAETCGAQRDFGTADLLECTRTPHEKGRHIACADVAIAAWPGGHAPTPADMDEK